MVERRPSAQIRSILKLGSRNSSYRSSVGGSKQCLVFERGGFADRMAASRRPCKETKPILCNALPKDKFNIDSTECTMQMMVLIDDGSDWNGMIRRN
jgi:hypothetical protein